MMGRGKGLGVEVIFELLYKCDWNLVTGLIMTIFI